ncbi:hypothetical protein ACC739_37530, partial [Rhizobium ruizarguesonis]
DLFAVPDASSVIQLPWKKDVSWVAADCVMDDHPVEQAPRVLLKRLVGMSRRKIEPGCKARKAGAIFLHIGDGFCGDQLGALA